jgi:hypothetical protein
MSGKGDCYDNAMVGMFFKVEIRAGLAHRPSIRAPKRKIAFPAILTGSTIRSSDTRRLPFLSPAQFEKRARVLRQCLSTLRK